jgi:hypothetical protein
MYYVEQCWCDQFQLLHNVWLSVCRHEYVCLILSVYKCFQLLHAVYRFQVTNCNVVQLLSGLYRFIIMFILYTLNCSALLRFSWAKLP